MKYIKAPIAWVCGVAWLAITCIIMVPTFALLWLAHLFGATLALDPVDDVLLWLLQQLDKVNKWSMS